MDALRVLILFDTDYPPPGDQNFTSLARIHKSEVEFQVAAALRRCGHRVRLLGFRNDLGALLAGLVAEPSDVVFNLCERFGGNCSLDAAVTGMLEMLGLAYTGSPPAALWLARDKAKTKHVLAGCGVPVPRFFEVPTAQPMAHCSLRYPVIVKPLEEDASVGISLKAIVNSFEAVAERVALVHRRYGAAIVEEFIEGRELYVGVMGDPPQALPAREMLFHGDTPARARIATFRAKWDWDYRKQHGIRNRRALKMPANVQQHLSDIAVRSFVALGLRDYARVDVRLSADGIPYVIEVNPNPYLAWGEDMSESAASVGLGYSQFLESLVHMALKMRSSRQSQL